MKKTLLYFAMFILTFSFAMAQLNDLHDFYPYGEGSEGSSPMHNRVISGGGNILYGMTTDGGDYNGGTIFRIDKDGDNFYTLHHFVTMEAESTYIYSNPLGSLTKVGNNLFGVTYFGGDNNSGVIFKYNIVSDIYTVLYEFGNEGDGINPVGTLAWDGGNYLYGMTQYGGYDDLGTIFKFNINTNLCQVVYDFEFDFDESFGCPTGDLIYEAGMLYGIADGGWGGNMSLQGRGPNLFGELFSFKTSTNVFTNLHTFYYGETGPINWISETNGYRLAKNGNILYGTTLSDDESGTSTIFSYNLGSGDYNTLYWFPNEWNNNGDPNLTYGGLSLRISGSIVYLYGTGISTDENYAKIFKYNVNNNIMKFTDFNSMWNQPDYLFSGLYLDGTTLFGLSNDGDDGETDDYGFIYSYDFYIQNGFPEDNPSTQTNGIVFNNVGQYQIGLNFTVGDGDGRIVLCKEAIQITEPPLIQDNVHYNANSFFKQGDKVDNGYIVYNGDGNTVLVKNLSRGRIYHFRAFEYNGSPGNEIYLKTPAAYNPHYKMTLKKEGVEDLNPTLNDKQTYFYPNPSNETAILNMNLDEQGSYEISIFDGNGKLMNETTQKVKLSAGKNEIKLDVSKFIPGTYNVLISSEGTFMIDSFVVQR